MEKYYNSRLCTFTAEIENNSKHVLSGLILKVKVYNKSKKQLVVQKYASLPISIYPTVKKKESIEFNASAIGEVISQLGNNYYWNYELIAYLPSEFYHAPESSESKEHVDFFDDGDDSADWVGDYSWLDQ